MSLRSLKLLHALQLQHRTDVLCNHSLHTLSAMRTRTQQEFVDMGFELDEAARLVTRLHDPEHQASDLPIENYRGEFASQDAPPSIEGYLQKKAMTSWILGWQRRYFRAQGAYLHYFQDEFAAEEADILRTMDIRQVVAVNVFQRQFEVVCPDYRFVLKAQDSEEANRWATNIMQRKNILLAQPSFQGSMELREVGGTSGGTARSAATTTQDTIPLGEQDMSDERIKEYLVAQVTDEEIALAWQLRSRYQPEDHVTWGMLVRFLRARSHDLDLAESFLRTHLEWRNETFPIEPVDIADELLKGKYLFLGRDLGGAPCILIDSTRLGAHTYEDFDNMLSAMVYAIDQMCEVHLGPLGLFTVIYSRVGANLNNLDLPWCKGVADLLQDNYPERLNRAVVVPCNLAFRCLWRVVKPLFDPKTADKITLLDGSKRIQELVGIEVIPTMLGGQSTIDREPFDMQILLDPEGYTAKTGRPL